MRLLFLGTPPAAVPALRALDAISDVVAVITRPDRARGRSGRPRPSAVADAAQSMGLDVHKPGGADELEALVTGFEVDVAVVVAFGMLVRPSSLDRPRCGFVNVHFSVLPRWRGAAPVQRAVMAGDPRTGVTLMRMDAGLDTGPVLVTRSTAIAARENASELTDRLAVMGAGLIAEHLQAIVDGRVVPIPQDAGRVTVAPKVAGEERWVRLDDGADAIARAVRGLTPWPGAWVRASTGPLRIVEVAPTSRHADPGELRLDGGDLILGTAHGSLVLVVVQPAGRRPMGGADWARGMRDGPGRVT